MSAKPIIREARPEDAGIIVEFNRALAAESEDRTLDPATLRPGVAAALDDRAKCRYFVAEIEGRVVGQTMLTYEWSDWRNGWFWWIQSVYVEAAHRRQGVFRSLHRHIRELARTSGECCGLRLYVERENGHAQATYQSLGMQATGYFVLEEDWSE